MKAFNKKRKPKGIAKCNSSDFHNLIIRRSFPYHNHFETYSAKCNKIKLHVPCGDKLAL